MVRTAEPLLRGCWLCRTRSVLRWQFLQQRLLVSVAGLPRQADQSLPNQGILFVVTLERDTFGKVHVAKESTCRRCDTLLVCLHNHGEVRAVVWKCCITS